MNIELTGSGEVGLDARVARFAALADPIRLRIVDLLTLQDSAPAELQESLGISSNLLAHHLKVLQDAQIVNRRRSTGDRRRTYVQLAKTAFDALLPRPTLAARRVLFVCTANSARSQLAAASWQSRSEVPVASAGTHPAPEIDPGALAALERHGLTPCAAGPQRIEDVHAADDVIITVCDSAHEELLGTDDLHWSIPDPVAAGSAAAFDAALGELEARIAHLAPAIVTAR